jgi:FkbM family methyltransferase
MTTNPWTTDAGTTDAGTTDAGDPPTTTRPPRPAGGTLRVPAVHPMWTGYLVLSPADGIVTHEASGNRGRYQASPDGVSVDWDLYGREVYRDVSGTLTQATLVSEQDFADLHATRVGGKLLAVSRFSVRLPDDGYEVSLRPRTTDIPTFRKVFIDREYESPQLPPDAATIVDLGANIGLASVYFARRYKRARLLAVEPDAANCALLDANIAAVSDRARRIEGAAWSRDGQVEMQAEDENGMALGAWGYRVGQEGGKARRPVPGYRVDTLCAMAGFATIDILKIDIEGAELDLFGVNAATWLAWTNFILIETHDRFRPGAEATVREAVRADFEELPRMGENLVFRRR